MIKIEIDLSKEDDLGKCVIGKCSGSQALGEALMIVNIIYSTLSDQSAIVAKIFKQEVMDKFSPVWHVTDGHVVKETKNEPSGDTSVNDIMDKLYESLDDFSALIESLRKHKEE